MERAKGFEPSTPTLARLCSTPELRPRSRRRPRSYRGDSDLQPRLDRRPLRPRPASAKSSADGRAQSTEMIASERQALPTTPEALLARLSELGIVSRTVAHPPVFTVEESK